MIGLRKIDLTKENKTSIIKKGAQKFNKMHSIDATGVGKLSQCKSLQ